MPKWPVRSALWPAAQTPQPSTPKRRLNGLVTGSPSRTLRTIPGAAARRGVRVRLLLQGKIDYRFAEGRYERLPALAKALVARGVAREAARDRAAGGLGRPRPVVLADRQQHIVTNRQGLVLRQIFRDTTAEQRLNLPRLQPMLKQYNHLKNDR